MNFTPITAEEAEKAKKTGSLWEAGDYGFDVQDALEKTSKAGNDMIELVLNVYNEHGDVKQVRDYLLESIAWKIRSAAQACGLSTEYDSGHLTAMDFVGKSGKLQLKIQKSKDPQYGDKNVVADYYMAVSGAVTPAKKPVELDDEIPF